MGGDSFGPEDYSADYVKKKQFHLNLNFYLEQTTANYTLYRIGKPDTLKKVIAGVLGGRRRPPSCLLSNCKLSKCELSNCKEFTRLIPAF